MTLYDFTTLGTMLICIAIAMIAIIRLRLCNGRRKPRLKYTLIMSSSLIGMAQPVLAYSWPGATALCFSAMFLIVLVWGIPPLRQYKDSNDFFDTALYDPHIHGED